MKRNPVYRTNLLVCAVIVVGFIVTSSISYHSNMDIFRKDVENVSTLSLEGIYNQIDAIFTKPVHIAETMASDSLLKTFLSEEEGHLDDAAFIASMQDYLETYRQKYDYDSVFLVSAKTNRYYHFNGLDRTLTPDNPENVWYYDFLISDEDYSLNIDNDEAASDDITIFINSRIRDDGDGTMGVVGVGFRVEDMQELLREYENQFGVRAYLVDGNGTLELSTEQTGFQKVDFFDASAFSSLQKQILDDQGEPQTFWYSSEKGKGYVVTQYVPNLDWHLIVSTDTRELDRQLSFQFAGAMFIILVVIVAVLLIITRVMRKYNVRLVQLAVSREQEHRSRFQEATERLYENIYEVDITHNRAASEATQQYFESLGVPRETPYDEALGIIAEKQIKEEFRKGYLDIFSPTNVLRTYENGAEDLRYDFMIAGDGGQYYWMRIIAHVFFWEDDQSVRMFVYRQNIDAEKRHERSLFEQMERDSLTGLFNKAATREHVRTLLAEKAGFAFFILDIDDFKQVNDRYGHAMGDAVLEEFARILREQLPAKAVIGRIGGDEFVAFLRVESPAAIEKTARTLVAALNRDITADMGRCHISASLGVAMAPADGTDFETLYRHADTALYRTKAAGKNGYTLYGA